jgi:surface antigen
MSRPKQLIPSLVQVTDQRLAVKKVTGKGKSNKSISGLEVLQMDRVLAQLGAAMIVLMLLFPSVSQARSILQCVPFARQMSGIEIRGNAKTWWYQAEGRYERGQAPREGAVLAMPGHGKMRNGHVATVSKIVSDREILLTHANWSTRGGIERNVRAIDVSDEGNWSRVRIWYARNGDLGTSSYPAYGFIYPGKASVQTEVRTALFLPADVLELAAKGS